MYLIKKIFFILAVSFLSFFSSNAQNQVKKESTAFGISFSGFGNYDVISTGRIGDEYPKFSSNSFYSPGLSFFLRTKKLVEIETGVYYNYHSINIDNTFYVPGTGTVEKRITERMEFIELPLNVRFDLPYFYASTGLLIDFEMENSNIVDEQSGIGFNTSLGTSYKFKSGFLVYAGPVVYIHTIFPIDKDKLCGYSFKIGVAFN